MTDWFADEIASSRRDVALDGGMIFPLFPQPAGLRSMRFGLAVAGLVLCLAGAVLAQDGSGDPSLVFHDRFIDLARHYQPDLEATPVIENGRHALEAQFATRQSPTAILEAFRKAFADAKLECQVLPPAPDRPVGLFRGTMVGEEKRILILPMAGSGDYLVKITSFQDGRLLKSRFPSLIERYPELRSLRDCFVFSRETIAPNACSALFVLQTRQISADAIEQATARLRAAGWEAVSAAGDGPRLLTKGRATVTVAAVEDQGGVTLVMTVAERR